MEERKGGGTFGNNIVGVRSKSLRRRGGTGPHSGGAASGQTGYKKRGQKKAPDGKELS